jgi:hypothetical protein
MGHRIGCHRNLVAGTENQVSWAGSRDVADLEAPEDDARSQQHLVQADMLSVRPDFVISWARLGDLRLTPPVGARGAVGYGRIKFSHNLRNTSARPERQPFGGPGVAIDPP